MPYLILGMLVGAMILMATFMGLKWLLMVWMVLGGILLLASIAHRYRNLEMFLILSFIPLSSLKIDVHLMRVGGEPAFAVTPLNIVWILLMIVWFVRLWQGQARVSLRSVFSVPLLLILAGALIAAVRAEPLIVGARGILQVIQCVTLFVYFLNRESTEQDARLFYWTICLTLGAQSLLGVLQGATGGSFGSQYFGAGEASYMDLTYGGLTISRVGGSIGHSNTYALYLNSLIFVPFVVMVSRRTGLLRNLGAAVFLLTGAALAMSKSRGGWVGFAFCTLLFAYVLFRERYGPPKAAFIVVGVVLTLAILVVVTPATRDRLLSDDYGAAQSRIPMTMTALNMIAHHPVLGVGTGNYKNYYHDYDRTPEGHTYLFEYPVHNAFLLMAAEYGILVLLAYLAVMLRVWREAFRRSERLESSLSKMLAYGLGASFVAQAIIWQVEISYPLTGLFTWFLLGLTVSMSQVGQRQVAGADIAPLPGQAAG